MSKRRTSTISDIFYQDWCFIREEAQATSSTEWTIRTPRPLQAPPAGRFYGVEIHSIEFKHTSLIRAGQAPHLQVALTFAPRTGHDAFITGPGYPHNLWWFDAQTDLGTIQGPAEYEQGSHNSKAKFTDDKGHGRLVTGDAIYLQLTTSLFAAAVAVEFAIQYTFTTVSCQEYTQQLTEVATAGY